MAMNSVRLVVCVLASLPAGWFAGVLYERVPPRRPLFDPFPGIVVRGARLAIHLMVTALFVLAAVRFSDVGPLAVLAYLVFFVAVAALSAIDFETQRLPDAIVAGALMVCIPLVAVASLADRDAERIQFAVIGGLVYFGFLLITHVVFPRGMGFGDVKLSALMGLFIGWAATSGLTALALVMYAMFVGFLVGSLAGVALFALRGRSKHYPFGPFLVGGAIVAIVFAPQLAPLAG